MTDTKFYNDPISVTASMDHTGHITPSSLTWQGRTYTLVAIGRQWKTENGRHVLVEAASGDRFEIELSGTDLLWHVRRVWPAQIVV